MAACPVVGCMQGRAREKLMCEPHWELVPKALRDAIVESYPKGILSDEYRNAMHEAIHYVRLLVEKEKPLSLFG